MSGFANVCWWLTFTCVGIVVEMVFPRIDALATACILLMQERGYKTLFWLMPLFVLLQEGLGTRNFGGSIVWYTVIFLFFRLGERFFTCDTLLFVIFLAAACGCAYYGINLLLAPLQDLEVDVQSLLDASLLQALYLPISWCICKYLRRDAKEKDE